MAHTVKYQIMVIIFTFQIFLVKKHYKLFLKCRIEIWFPILFNISVLIDVHRVIYQKTAHFLSAHMALVSTFFQMFIVLGMYNFGLILVMHQLRLIRSL